MRQEVLRLGERRAVRLVEVLGEGGFGVVWRGELTGAAGLMKPVAVKVLNRSAAEIPELASRLRDEARMLALLRHRAIVGVDDLVEVDGRWALVMEYVEGVDLERLMEAGPLPARPLCEVLLEAASALHAAHSATHPVTGAPLELVHRDIKPANLRITAGGEVKLLDFGIARARFEAREATTRDLSFGSVGYMAPERWEGREGPPSDVYALGIVGIEALSGSQLGQLPVEAQRHAARLHVALNALETIPEELRDLLAAMTDYFPEQRPSAAKVVTGLRATLLLAEGPWLAEWAPGALASLPAPERSERSAGDNTPTFASQAAQVREPPPRTEVLAPAEPPPERGRGGRWLALGGLVVVLAAAVLVVGVAGVGGAAWFLAAPAPAPAPTVTAPAPEPSEPPPVDEGTAAPAPEPAPLARPVPEPVAKPAPRPAPVPAPVAHSAPVPAPTARPEPAPVALGEVVLDSSGIQNAVLRGADGKTHYPGPLPAGTYSARVTFTDGVTIQVDAIPVRAAQTTTLKCSDRAQTCMIR